VKDYTRLVPKISWSTAVKKLTILGSAILLAGGWQLALAQPPGGGGGRGGFGGMTFDALNTDKDNHEMMGKGDDAHEVQILSMEEVEAYFNQLFAGRQGGGGPPGGGGGRAGGGDFIQGMFSRWDADGSGGVTEEEFNNRPRGRRGGGGPGGPPPQ
jgi:hypothetical protein